MTNTFHYPVIIFTASVFTLWLSGRLGRLMIRKRRQLDEELRTDFVVILGAALTLLALIIGFSFSMSAARYDLRKNREATEANAFGNSTGDQQMLEYTQGGSGARLMMLVHHDDAEREFAYGPDSTIGTFNDALMAEAKDRKWTVVSMKDDWKTIFAYDKPIP